MIKDIKGLVEHISASMRATADVAVVGLSGGADSTLVACLAVRAFGRDNVYGVHMPYGKTDTSGVNFNARSKLLANELGIQSLSTSVSDIAQTINEAVDNALRLDVDQTLSKVNQGNARSRARMTVLYGIAHHLNEKLGRRVRVVGTGNLSEDFIGYDTKGGDALCDFFPIGELFKSEVYQLLNYFVEQRYIEEEHIDRVPSAGLWEGQTDEGELGYTYNEMEPVIKAFRSFKAFGRELTVLEKFVLDRHHANAHKHLAPPVFSLREFCDE